MLKKLLKKIFKKISFNYSEIINKIDENEEKRNHKLIESKQESQYYLENKFEDLNNKLNTINDIFYKKQEELNKKIDMIASEHQNKLDIIYNRTNQFDYYNIENNIMAMNRTNNKKILIIGFYGAPNIGDELMLETLIQKLSDINEYEITVMLADNPRYDVEKYPAIRFIHYPKNIFEFNILAEQYDYFIFGGGAIIDDTNYEKEYAYRYDLGTILIKLSIRAIAFEKKVIALALSSSTTITNENYIKKLSYIINNSEYFSVRDENSFKIIKENCNIEEKKLNILQDLVLANDILQKRNRINIKNENKTIRKLNIGIVWISAYENQEKLIKIIHDINEYYDNKKITCEINLIPFYNFNDIDIKFYEETLENENFNNVNICKFTNNIDEITNLFMKQNIIISLRYHGVLLSYALGIPCISICYNIHEHYKNKMEYLNRIFKNNENAIDYTELTKEKMFLILDNIQQNTITNQESVIQLLKKSQIDLENVINKIFYNNSTGGKNGEC